jgi:hypothetical protein
LNNKRQLWQGESVVEGEDEEVEEDEGAMQVQFRASFTPATI